MLPAFFAQSEKLGTSVIELNMATTSNCTWKEVELRCWDSGCLASRWEQIPCLSLTFRLSKTVVQAVKSS